MWYVAHYQGAKRTLHSAYSVVRDIALLLLRPKYPEADVEDLFMANDQSL